MQKLKQSCGLGPAVHGLRGLFALEECAVRWPTGEYNKSLWASSRISCFPCCTRCGHWKRCCKLIWLLRCDLIPEGLPFFEACAAFFQVEEAGVGGGVEGADAEPSEEFVDKANDVFAAADVEGETVAGVFEANVNFDGEFGSFDAPPFGLGEVGGGG